VKSSDLLSKLSPSARAFVNRQIQRTPTKAARPARIQCAAAQQSPRIAQVEVMLASHTVSTNVMNAEPWHVRGARARTHRRAAYLALMAQQPLPALPVVVTLTRFGKRLLDGDNLSGSTMKAIRDGVQDAYAVDDADPRYEWRYRQEKSKDYGVGIEIRRNV
jgi:hypothetical protein